MFRTVAEFTEAWKYESGSTLKIMQALSDQSLAQKVTPEGRSLGRLAWHIFKRNRGKAEDFRYAAWRRQWGKYFVVRSFGQIFMLQGLLLLLIISPVLLVVGQEQPPLGLLDGLGVMVWLAGLAFEAIGDRQLAAFLKNPANRGKLMTGGLWRFTRHPNYFGEAALWWGMAILALSAPHGWLGLIGPMVITFLLLFVSGVPLLEKKYRGRPDWEEYKKKTPVFFPWFPKEGTGDRV